jgi:hypothetical protein
VGQRQERTSPNNDMTTPTHYTHKSKSLSPKFPFSLAVIRWVDSGYGFGWKRGDIPTKPLECLTIGWVIENNKTAITLSCTLTDESDDQQRCGDITIPHSSITAVYRV